MQEMEDALANGATLDELWAVARGHTPYSDFLSMYQERKNMPSTSDVPDDLVSLTLFLQTG